MSLLTPLGRRAFLRSTGLTAAAGAVGAAVPPAAEAGGKGIHRTGRAGSGDTRRQDHGATTTAQPSRTAASRVNAGIGMPWGHAPRQGVPSHERHAPAPAPSAA